MCHNLYNELEGKSHHDKQTHWCPLCASSLSTLTVWAHAGPIQSTNLKFKNQSQYQFHWKNNQRRNKNTENMLTLVKVSIRWYWDPGYTQDFKPGWAFFFFGTWVDAEQWPRSEIGGISPGAIPELDAGQTSRLGTGVGTAVQRLATCSSDRTIKVFDVVDGDTQKSSVGQTLKGYVHYCNECALLDHSCSFK